MEIDMGKISRILEQLILAYGRDGLRRIMYHYFRGICGRNRRSGDMLGALTNAELFGGFDTKTCKDFSDWFSKIDSCGDCYEDFKSLTNSRQFLSLCLCLYQSDFLAEFRWNQIVLKSSDGVVSKMDKKVAAAESELLRGFVSRDIPGDLLPSGGGEIPMEIPSYVLSEIIHFVEKKHDFSQSSKSVLGHYKGWFTEFLKRNRAILCDLHEAADFLSIKSLFDLTGPAVKELKEKTPEEISTWCGNLTISQLSSSLEVGVGEDDVPHHGSNWFAAD